MSPSLILAGFLYEAFLGAFIVAVGGGIIVLVSFLAARLLGDARYWSAARVYTKASAELFAMATALLILAILFAGSASPVAEMSLPYLFSIWGAPLALTLVLAVGAAGLLSLGYRLSSAGGPSGASTTLLAVLGAAVGCLAIVTFNLINTFMIAPTIPSGLAVIEQAGRIDPITQLGLMNNRSWIPLTIKLLLIGSLTFSALFSGAAALRRWRGRASEEGKAWLDFMTSWGFKTAILFGAPVGVIGYWNASILHTTVPTLALGLMGVATTGISAALVSGLGPLWAIGIALSMSLGALGGTYYLVRGHGRIRQQGGEQKILSASLPWLLVLLVLSTYAVLYVGEWYPQQFVLGMAVLFDGIILFEAVRRYALGRVRLYVPALIFTMSCYGLLLYQAPYTQWYNAASFGGVSWPLIGFPLLAVTLYYFATRWAEMKYLIPATVSVVSLLVLVVKMADVELVKGATIVALDPGTKSVVQSWAFINGFDLSSLYVEYPNPSNTELFIILLASFVFFLGVYALITRAVTSGTRSKASESGAVLGVS